MIKVNNEAHFLVLGATGAIGSACAEKLKSFGLVVCGSRDLSELKNQIDTTSSFNGVVWAQGVNASDSAFDFDIEKLRGLIEGNVSFILQSLKILLEGGKLNQSSQLVILSSIWSQASRPNKLSYGVSKSAVSGLVRSLAVDLGHMGVHVNSVSPGPIDSPMTMENLKPEELNRIISESPLKRLATLEEVSSTVCELARGKLTGVTGQEIIIDCGWSVSKLV
jgi:NAD(P)-dependent dehydrogenase (short-subunit alcohol dehydrogenase family)